MENKNKVTEITMKITEFDYAELKAKSKMTGLSVEHLAALQVKAAAKAMFSLHDELGIQETHH